MEMSSPISPSGTSQPFASFPSPPPVNAGSRVADNSGTGKTGAAGGAGLKVVVVVLALVLALFVALFAWKAHEASNNNSTTNGGSINPNNPNAPANGGGVISSTLESWIRSAMNPTADPCEDFFQYTCGNFVRNNPLPADAPYGLTRSFDSAHNISEVDFQNVLDDQFSQAGQYFRACRGWNNVTASATDPRAARSMKSLARWLDLVDENFNVASPSYASFWYLLGVLHGQGLSVHNFLFKLELAQRYSSDTNNPLPDSMHRELQFEMTISWTSGTGNNAAMIPGSISVPFIDMLQQDLIAGGFNTRLYDDAVFTPSTIAERMMNQSELFQSWKGAGGTMLANLTELEMGGDVISSAYLRGVGNHSFAPMYAELHTYPLSEWTGYADHIVDVVLADVNYGSQLTAWMRAAFEGCSAADAAACHRLSILKSLLKLNLASSLLPALPYKYSAFLADAGLPVPWVPNRGGFCRDELMNDFENILYNEAFVRAFSPETTNAMEDMVTRIYNALGATLLETAWLDQQTMTKALNKWALITKNIAYDTTWNNLLFGIATTGQWELDIVAAHSYRFQRMLWACDLPFDIRTPQLVGMTAWTQNAYYMPSLNSINMLPGLMLFPLFDASNPMMLNLAQMGWVIGHELIHGFDDNGRKYDAVGQFKNWWSAGAVAEFDSRAQCLINQYSNLTVKVNGSTYAVDGALTLGENIADNGGIGLAWRAYRSLYNNAATNITQPLFSGLTNDQLFWVMASQVWCTSDNANSATNSGDVHAQPQIRSYAPLANRPEFAQAFQCSPSSYMGRSLTANKCQIW